MNNIILAIETSCDDTSIAILNNEKVISCITKDSTKFLNQYGGIVPEIASRKHQEMIMEVFDLALKESNISKYDINHICYTNEPGLPGSLHVGEIFAKSIGMILNIEPKPINHIHGHILSPFIDKEPCFPYLSLIASGKTTSIFLVKDENHIEEITKTMDDAVGETFDKIGKALGYDYPSGPIIDKNYDSSKATIKIDIPNPKSDFSFSGVKSKIFNIIDQSKKNNTLDKITIGSSFQKWAIDTLISKLSYYKNIHNINIVTIGGGVSANSLFKKEINELFERSYVPSPKYSCDNAAMIGYVYYVKYIRNN